MAVGSSRRTSPARRALDEALLQEERLANVLDRSRIFANAGGDGFETHRPTAELLDDRCEDGAVQPVETEPIDFKHGKRFVGNRLRNRVVLVDLGKIPDPAQEAIGDAGRTARSARNLSGAMLIDAVAEDARRPRDDLEQRLLIVKVEVAHDAETVS